MQEDPVALVDVFGQVERILPGQSGGAAVEWPADQSDSGGATNGSPPLRRQRTSSIVTYAV